MSLARPRPCSYLARCAAVAPMAIALVAAGCGARGGLLPYESGGAPGDPQDAAAPVLDAPSESPAPDGASPRCASLVQVGDPIQVFGEDGLHYVGPIVATRSGGFDIVAFQNNGPSAPSHAAVARRAIVTQPSGPLTWKYQEVLDPEATTIGEAAVSGDLLGSCRGADNYESRVFTFQTHDGAYAMHGQRRRPMPDPRCFAIAGRAGRWVAFWLGEPGSPATSLFRGEFSDTAEILSEATLVTDIGTEVRATSYGAGLAYSGHGSNRVSLTFLPDLGSETTVQLDAQGTIGSSTLMAPWPWRDDAVALIWEEAAADGAPTTMRLQAVADSGEVVLNHQLDGDYPVRAIPAIAAMDDRLIVAAAAFDDYGADTGTIHVSMVDESGAMIGARTDVPFQRGDLNDQHDVSIAATNELVMVVWAVRPGLPNPGVWGALLGCRD